MLFALYFFVGTHCLMFSATEACSKLTENNSLNFIQINEYSFIKAHIVDCKICGKRPSLVIWLFFSDVSSMNNVLLPTERSLNAFYPILCNLLRLLCVVMYSNQSICYQQSCHRSHADIWCEHQVKLWSFSRMIWCTVLLTRDWLTV